MTLHIFNPDHDIALASALENFTAPHAGRQLRHDLGWIPVLWADEDDSVYGEDEEAAQRSIHRIQGKLTARCKAQYSSHPDFSHVTAVEPWGWNAALRCQLLRLGVDEQALPSKEIIERMRNLSHRRTSAALLRALTSQGVSETGRTIIGEAEECRTEEEVVACQQRWGKVVIKAPWSSSGRGVRFVEDVMTDSMKGWLRNILKSQTSVMVEPYYNKVKDFAMEFTSDGRGTIAYRGLSLFHTMNGAYTGNLLATEKYKEQYLGQYIANDTLEEIRQLICQELSPIIGETYKGPFGIDMMVVATSDAQGFLLHPCVEINLRRTMGHVALSLTQRINPQEDEGIVRVMRVLYEDNQYKLKIQRP